MCEIITYFAFTLFTLMYEAIPNKCYTFILTVLGFKKFGHFVSQISDMVGLLNLIK